VTDHRSSSAPDAATPEECLCHRYLPSQKGGTLIAEDVLTLEHHEKMLSTGGYRPHLGCPKCAGHLHIHDYRGRLLLADPASLITVVRFLCYSCGATWQVLPAFVARHLWRSWQTVERAVERAHQAPTLANDSVPPSTEIPERTLRRWLTRLVASAALLVVTLSTAETPLLASVAGAVGLGGSRRDLVDVHARIRVVPVGQRLMQIAALVHRLAPGVRLM
jgi:hypothetical protein